MNERDLDADGYRTCGVPADCNDNNSYINPGMQEWCSDTKDNNCNSQTDETPCICPDADSDGFTASYCGGTDCDDINNTIYPGAPELCTDGKDNDCNGLKDCADPNAINCPAITDADGDGYDVAGICGTADCDDNDNKVYPGAAEICDGKDSNCDGWKAPSDKDTDGDGVPVCAGDCNDNNANISPLILERHLGDPLCSDGIDNDCDGRADAADNGCSAGSCNTTTSPKDSPHFFTLLNPDNTVHAQNNSLSCGKCHAADYNDPIRFACQRCHADTADTSDPLNGTLKQHYPLAPPYGYGTAPNVAMHSSTAAGTKYGSWTMGDKGCVTCHNPHAQEQNNVFGTDYGMFIKEYVCFNNPVTGLNIQEFVEFTSATGQGSFADGPRNNENICEMCHTQTNHHNRDGSASGDKDGNSNYVGHYDGSKCTFCHTHDGGFKPGAAGQSHTTHLKDEKGPKISCDSTNRGCHGTAQPPLFADGNNLAATTVCNNCHSPNGSFDGVNDPVTGAKVNWSSGIYEGKILPAGKEKWCAGCHDEAPGNSKLDGTGINAPNVAGDNSTYGYYATGHGSGQLVDCVHCHDFSKPHIDHIYYPVRDIIGTGLSTTPPQDPANYRFYDGKDMRLPYYQVSSGQPQADDFALCFSCHDQALAVEASGASTNFRDLNTTWGPDIHNLHQGHISANGADRNTSCIFCHDPHGTNRPKMTVMSRMGDFRQLCYRGSDNRYFELNSPQCDNPALSNGGVIVSNASCASCHSAISPSYLSAGLVGNTGWGWYVRDYAAQTYYVDFDFDDDGLNDNADNCTDVLNPDQTDTDLDGIGDVCDNCPFTTSSNRTDSDLDGSGDACDACPNDFYNDADADGICGDVDICPADPLNDIDADGVCGDTDNCSNTANADQADYDRDGTGDACDLTCDIDRTTQHWVNIYPDHDDSYAIAEDTNYIYITGYTRKPLAGAGNIDAYIAKFTKDGVEQWLRQFGSTAQDYGTGLAVDNSGNVYVTGHTYGELVAGQLSGESDVFISKYDANGNNIWTRQFGTAYSDTGEDIAVDSSGNVYVTGVTWSDPATGQYVGAPNIFTGKYDINGQEVWKRYFGTWIPSDYGKGIALDSGENYVYVSGGTCTSTCALTLFKYDALTGAPVWESILPENPGISQDITLDSSGNVYVIGSKDSGAPTRNDVYIGKYDADGQSIWTQTLASNLNDYGYGIDLDAEENYIFVTGTTSGAFPGDTNQGYTDVFIGKYDTAGNKVWTKQFGIGTSFDEVRGIAVGADGSMFTTGQSMNSSFSSYDVFLMKTVECP
jgi:predicted CXXCH cytochrome family protein